MVPWYIIPKYSSFMINFHYILTRILMSWVPKLNYISKQFYDINFIAFYSIIFIVINILNFIYMKNIKNK